MDSPLNKRRPLSIFSTRPFLVDEPTKAISSASWPKWLAFVVLLLTALAVLLWSLPNSSSKIQARIDALKNAGYPITAQDLDKMYPPLPDAQNSVVIYQKAFLHYLSLPEDATNWPIVSASIFPLPAQPLPRDVKQGIADYVNQNENTLALLHQAAGIEKGYYETGFKNGFPTSVQPPFVQIRQNAQLLALAVILRAEDRQPGPATTLLLDSFGLLRSLEHDPQLVSQMISDSILRLNCSSLELALNKISLSDDQLRSLAAAFHEVESSDGLKQSLIYDRCWGIWLRDLITANPFNRPNEPLRGKLGDLYSRVRYYRESDFIFYLDTMEEYIAAVDMPYPKKLKVGKQLATKAKESDESKRAFGILLVTPWDEYFVHDAKTHAQLLLSETALAIERYRLAHQDQLPAMLQDLVPAYLQAVPADPFDGKPLRYNRLPKGYLLYSIGEDGVDNGGMDWNSETKTGDLTFTVER
jgi:hypothetical protein